MSIDEVADKLIAGCIGVIPTDTQYGVVAKADDPQAVERLYQLKKPKQDPGTLIAASIDQLTELGLKRRYLTAVDSYWPGAVSVIIPTGPVLANLHRGKYSLAVRIPDYRPLTELLSKTGPLLTSSANYHGEPPAQNIEQAKQYFGDKLDFYFDGGVLDGPPSTIIRVIDDAVEVLRIGAVKIDETTGGIIK